MSDWVTEGREREGPRVSRMVKTSCLYLDELLTCQGHSTFDQWYIQINRRVQCSEWKSRQLGRSEGQASVFFE